MPIPFTLLHDVVITKNSKALTPSNSSDKTGSMARWYGYKYSALVRIATTTTMNLTNMPYSLVSYCFNTCNKCWGMVSFADMAIHHLVSSRTFSDLTTCRDPGITWALIWVHVCDGMILMSRFRALTNTSDLASDTAALFQNVMMEEAHGW